MADTLLDMATASPVPILSGTQTIGEYWNISGVLLPKNIIFMLFKC